MKSFSIFAFVANCNIKRGETIFGGIRAVSFFFFFFPSCNSGIQLSVQVFVPRIFYVKVSFKGYLGWLWVIFSGNELTPLLWTHSLLFLFSTQNCCLALSFLTSAFLPIYLPVMPRNKDDDYCYYIWVNLSRFSQFVWTVQRSFLLAILCGQPFRD